MSYRSLLLFTSIAAIPVYLLYLKRAPPLPKLDVNEWWGPEELKATGDITVKPFRVNFSTVMIEDLKERLQRYRAGPPPLDGVGFEYGFNGGQVGPWLHYWAERYPFEERERFLNQFPQYKTNIQGLDIHFVRVKPVVVPRGVEVVPLLLLHGWPGSVREFFEAIPPLKSFSEDRDFAVEVIAPSLVGFGYSDPAVRPGMGSAQMAVVLRNLMTRLGHERFYAQGGDWGIALTDSPAGLLVYILQIFATWTRRDEAGRPDGLGIHFSEEQLIDNVMLYWAPNSITTAIRPHAEAFSGKHLDTKLDDFGIGRRPCYSSGSPDVVSFQDTVCCAHALLHTKREPLFQPPLVTKLKFTNVLGVKLVNGGGHFAAPELPEIFAGDLIEAIGEFREWNKENTEQTVR